MGPHYCSTVPKYLKTCTVNSLKNLKPLKKSKSSLSFSCYSTSLCRKLTPMEEKKNISANSDQQRVGYPNKDRKIRSVDHTMFGAWGTYLCEDAELVQGTLRGHGGGAGKAGGGRGVGCSGGGRGMMALLDQIWEVVDATGKAVPVRVLCGVMVVVVMMVVGTGGVLAKGRARARARTWGEARKPDGGLGLARAGARTLSVVTCTLEVERGVDDFGSRCVPDEFRGGEGVS